MLTCFLSLFYGSVVMNQRWLTRDLKVLLRENFFLSGGCWAH
jgi:hypothetical protein